MVNGRAKGASAERELSDKLLAWAYMEGIKLDLKRNLEQVRSGGYDLIGLEKHGLAVECKRVETLAIKQWWDQAVRQAGKDLIPVLAWRQNRNPWRFKVRVWVYPCKIGTLDVVLEEACFKKWFIEQIRLK